MKLFKVFATIFSLLSLPSCAFLFNDKMVELAIDSNPSGADIVIEGVNYGRTPALIKIEPKNYIATLNKEGYGTAQLKLESWQAVRAKKDEGGRCIADTLGSVFILPMFSVWSVYCRDFKQPRYSVNIPYMGPAGSSPASNFNGGLRSSNNPYQNNMRVPARSNASNYGNQGGYYDGSSNDYSKGY